MPSTPPSPARGPHHPGRARAVILVAMLLATAGCSVLGPGRLDVPPGFRAVMGVIDLRGIRAPQGLIEIVREDGAVRYDLPAERGPAPFVLPLPPGRYRMTRFRVTDSGASILDQVDYWLDGTFEVGEAATYIGTLRFQQRRLDEVRLRVIVEDHFDRTVPALRARYPEIPAAVERALVRPGD